LYCRDHCYEYGSGGSGSIHISGVWGIYAASTDIKLPPECAQLLSLAEKRYMLQGQPSVFGHSIPMLTNKISALP